eukprot:12884375-Prorocentrum_lima.AAC.1
MGLHPTAEPVHEHSFSNAKETENTPEVARLISIARQEGMEAERKKTELLFSGSSSSIVPTAQAVAQASSI